MSISASETTVPVAEEVIVTDEALQIELSDGRSLSVPLAWFPRLMHAAPSEKNNWRLIGRGEGIHWADIDEDIRIRALLAGKGSEERQASFRKWLVLRKSSQTG